MRYSGWTAAAVDLSVFVIGPLMVSRLCMNRRGEGCLAAHVTVCDLMGLPNDMMVPPTALTVRIVHSRGVSRVCYCIVGYATDLDRRVIDADAGDCQWHLQLVSATTHTALNRTNDAANY